MVLYYSWTKDREIYHSQRRKDIYSMTKIKIAAVIVCMIATGAFAGFTYQAANNSGSEEKVTVKTIDRLTTDEELTDEETTADEEISDMDTTADETVTKDEETVIVLGRKAEKSDKTEKAEETETTTTTTTTAAPAKEEAPVIETHRQEIAAPVVTEAPVEQTEAVEQTEIAEQETEAPAEKITAAEQAAESEPVQEKAEEVEENKETVSEQPAETAPAVQEEEPEEKAEENSGRKIEVTDEEYIWLCNVVGHEYGSDWISEYEKAKVVEVVMNRVNDPRFPDTIWDVLTQPYQFSGLEWTLYLGDFSYQVTPSVKAAVDMYLEHPEDFDQGYLGFWGDGSMNHFYSI